MVRCASLFSQLLDLFPRTEFHQAVREYEGDRYSKGFSCWDQFVAMLFCQLAQAHSLREICGGLASCLGKMAHLGVSEAPKRSTLAYANAHRPWQVYERVFHQLLAKCHGAATGKRKFRFRNKLYSLDATMIDLCLSLFEWAKYRQTKGAVKLHLLLDHEGYLPVFARITDGKTHEVKIAHELEFAPGSIVVIDRGFTDYSLFGRWTADEIYFVTRLKRGADYRVMGRRHPIPERGILADEIIEFDGVVSKKKCPHPLRRIEYLDRETGEVYEYLTNHLEFGPTTIVRIYRDRWEIELFFKALKQNLKVKTFVGTSPNALKTQIWTALIAMLLLKYLQLRSRLKWSLSNLVALLRWNLFTYRELWTWLDDPFETPPLGSSTEQLALAFSSLGQQNGRP